MPGTRKLGRKTAHRNLMLRGLVTYLLENGKIETTYTRAKEVSALADKMITLGKKNDLNSYRAALAFITKETVAHNLFKKTAPKYANVNGGYTAVYKLGPRKGDGAEMAVVTLVDVIEETTETVSVKDEKKATKKAKKETKKTAKAEAEVNE